MPGTEDEQQPSFFSDPIKYIWGGNTGLSYGDLQHRRAIAQALASRKMGFPKNKGEGMTYLGESFNEGIQAMMLAREEAARSRMLKGEADKTVGKLPSASPTVTTEHPPDQTTTAPPPASTLGPYKVIPVKPQASVAPPTTVAADNPPTSDIPMSTGNAAVAARFPGPSTEGPARAVSTERIAPQAAADAPPIADPAATESMGPQYNPNRPGLPLSFAARAPDSAFQDSIQTRSAPDLLETGLNTSQAVFAPPTGAAQQMAFAPEEPLVPETGGGGDGDGGGGISAPVPLPHGDPRTYGGVRASIDAMLAQGGLSNNAISGAKMNIASESGFNPTLRHFDQPKFRGTEAENAHGLYQEGGDEWNKYTAWIDKNMPGADWRDPALQSKFFAENLHTPQYQGVLDRMNSASTPGRAAVEMLTGYLKPAQQYQVARTNEYLRGEGGSTPTGMIADRSAGGGSSSRAGGSPVQNVDPRDAITEALIAQNDGAQPQQQPQPDEQPQDTSSEAKLLELVGGGRKPGSPFRATASLDGRGGAPTMSDAPQPGLQPMGSLGGLEASAAERRNAIAGGLAAQPAPLPVPAQPPAQEVPPPPPDPTQSGTLPSPTTSGPPTGASPIQLAQAGPLDASMFSPQSIGGAQGISKAPAAGPPPSVSSAVPAPMVPAGQQTQAPAGWVPLPKPTPPRPQARAGYQPEEIDAIKRKMMSPNDPDVAATQQPIIDAYAAARKAADDREAERWRADVANYNALEKARLEHEAQRPKEEADVASTRQKTGEAIEKAALQQRFGGRDPEEFFKTFDKDHAEAQSAALVLRNNALALRAINDGVVTGWGANFRVDAKRLAAFALQNGMAGNEAANTQFLKAILTGSLGQAVRDIQGDGRNSASNTDVALAGRAAGSDPTLELGAIKRIIHAGNRISTDKINDFEDQRDTYFKNTNSERRYQLRGAEPKEPAYVEKLLGAPTKENKAAYDERFGEGSADLEIARAKRRGR